MGDVRDPERDQVAPTPNENKAIQDMVIEDIRERKEHGIRKYGTPVQAHNGRDMLLDAYEEVMDLAVYLRGTIEEGKGFEVRSDPRQRYRIIDANGVVHDGGISYGRDMMVLLDNLRPGDTLQEEYTTTTYRSEWHEISPDSRKRLDEAMERKAQFAKKRQ